MDRGSSSSEAIDAGGHAIADSVDVVEGGKDRLSDEIEIVVPHETDVDEMLDENGLILPHCPGNDDREVVVIECYPSDSGSSVRNIALSNTGDENRMCVPVMVETSLLPGLIDSGSDSSLIHLDFVKRMKIPIIPLPDKVIKGFGENNITKVVGKCNLVVSLNGQPMESAEFLILETGALGEFTIILGTDFLLLNRLTVSMQRSRLSRPYDDGTFWEYYVGRVDEPCFSVFSLIPCYASVAVTVAAGTTKKVPVEWTVPVALSGNASAELFLFEECDSMSKRQIYSGVIEGISGCGEVLLTNHNTASESVKAGEVVGRLSMVVDVDGIGIDREVYLAASDAVPAQKPLDVELGSHLSPGEQSQIRLMLDGQSVVFSCGDDDVGLLGVTEHRIELYDYTPIYQRPRRFPEVVNQEIESQCKQLELLDIIEPSTSPYSSPVVPIRKKDGTIRLCIDYRKLNTVTKPDKFPLPNLNDAIFGLSGVQYFTSMDLVRGYYQLPLEESSREYTAFSTPRAHWQFKRLSFGLKNAPSAFQREMQHILSPFPWRRVIVYIDDVLIMSDTFEEHLVLVERVLKVLTEYGVKIKRSKCHWFQKQVEFLGHVVSCDGLSKPRAYIEAIERFPRPTTVRELRSFLGLVNFQRKFIPNCSLTMKPLSKLTGGKKAAVLRWDDGMTKAFETLKCELKQELTLSFPDYSPHASPLELFTDASALGVGACLAQMQGGQLKRIAYASMAFTTAQQNYSTLERELAAIRWSVKSFRAFLFGVDFVVNTDHQPLVYLNNMRIVNSRLARTLEDLSDFNFVIKYLPGKTNLAADALSRVHCHGSTPSVNPVQPVLSAGLSLIDKVDGGGDSLVISLMEASKFLSFGVSLPATSDELRVLLVCELINSPLIYFPKSDKTLKSELRLMLHPGQLLCIEALMAFSKLFGCVVLVHHGCSIPVMYVAKTMPSVVHLPRLHLQCLSGVHYNPVRELASYVPSRLFVEQSSSDDAPSDKIVEISGEESAAEDDAFEILYIVPPAADDWCVTHMRMHTASVSVKCGSLNCCCLLDCGSQISCVSLNVVRSCSADINSDSIFSVRGIGDNRSLVLGYSRLEVRLGDGPPIIHNFTVVDERLMPFCFLLGADCLDSSGIDLDFDLQVCKYGTGIFPFRRGDAISVGLVGLFPLECVGKELSNRILEIHVGTVDDGLSFGIQRSEVGEFQGLTSLIEHDEIMKLQKRDRQLSALHRQLSKEFSGRWSKVISRFERYQDALSICQGVVTFQGSSGPNVCVVSFSLLVEICLVLHYKMAHLGRQKLWSIVREHVWHPSLSKVVADVTRSCLSCQRVKVAPTIQPPITKVVTRVPFELVAVDLIALPVTRRRHVGCLVTIDYNSKWLSAVPISSKKASVVTHALQSILPSLPRKPERLLSDNGPEFRSAEFNRLLDDFGITHVYSTPYKPSSNGLVERTNRTLTELFRNLSAPTDSWDDVLSKAIMTHNATYHSEICMSPAQYLLGREHKFVNSPVVSIEDVKYWKEGNPSFVPYRIGQKVLRKVVFKGRRLCDKLSDRFDGPFVISKVNNNKVTYWMRRCGSCEDVRAHHTQLKAFHEMPNYIQTHPFFIQLPDADDLDERPASLPDDTLTIEPVHNTFFPILGVYDTSDDSSSESDDSEISIVVSESEEEVTNRSSDGDFLGFLPDGPVISRDLLLKIRELESELLKTNLVSTMNEPDRRQINDILGDIAIPLPSWRSIDDCFSWPLVDEAVDCAEDQGDSFVNPLLSSMNEVRDSLQLMILDIERIEDIFSSTGSCSGLGSQDRSRNLSADVPGASAALAPVEIRNEGVGGVEKVTPAELDSSDVSSCLSQCRVAQHKLERLRVFISANRRESSLSRRELSHSDSDLYRPHTRSQGCVLNYPNVQPKILEYGNR